MAEETNNQDPAVETRTSIADPTPGDQQGEVERTFSQAEVNRMMANRVAKADRATEARVRAEYAAVTPPKEDAPPPAETPRDDDALKKLSASVGEILAQQAFDKATQGLNLDDDQASAVKASMDKPEVMTALLNAIASSKPAPAEGEAYVSPGASVAAPTAEDTLDSTKWGPEQIASYRGDGSFLQRIEKFRHSLPGGGGAVWSKKSINRAK